uniref:RHS repeat domain-containing protein n=1 Tax=Simplicispira lacusdiani TaxID=2213010 RepID=UPI001E4A35E3
SSQTGQGPDAPTTKYAHNALGQRVFKTEPLFAAASGKGTPTDSPLDDEEEPESPGLLKTLHAFFTRLWSPAKSDAEHLGWAYVYDEEGSLLGEYGTGGSQSAGQSQFLYLPTQSGPIPIAAEIDGRLYAIHTDHLGTPRRLTQADGQAAWQWAYTPYGDEAPTLGAQRFTNEMTNPTTGATNIPPVRFNLRYPGQYFDAESGLHYNYFRSYDPRTGRYTQSDPIGLQGGWNRFSYVEGNPLGLTDPTGLAAPALAPLLPIVIQVCRKVLAETLAAMAGAGAAAVIVEVTDCDDEKCKKDEDDCVTASQFHLKAAGIGDPHDFKRDFLGKRAPIKLWDICACKDGAIKIANHGACGFKGPKIETGYRWK